MTVDIGGLLGFTLSGMMFVLSALRTGDQFALAGSLIWIFSCLGWIAVLMRKGRPAPVFRSDGAVQSRDGGNGDKQQHS